MRNTRHKRIESDDDDLPANLDPRKLRFVGFGLGALPPYREAGKRSIAKTGVSVTLETDVAAVFKSSESVNKVLRAIIVSMPGNKKRKKRKAA
jgi:hypothetical protein